MAEHDDHHRRLRWPEAVASQRLEHKRCRKRRRCSQLLSLRSSSRGGASATAPAAPPLAPPSSRYGRVLLIAYAVVSDQSTEMDKYT